MYCYVFVFFKQKTAYELRISDWSSDVCSSDRSMRAAGDLGDDVAIKVERGARDFASGDRIIFLRNERSLEVKNGTLGTVERVSEQSMTVRTDDGRSVAFDMKDYRDLDHG